MRDRGAPAGGGIDGGIDPTPDPARSLLAAIAGPGEGGGAEGDRAPRRRGLAPDALVLGVVLTLLLHVGILAVVFWQRRAHKNDLLILPPDRMVMVARLGRKRDLSWLPHKAPPPGAHHGRAPSYTRDENARPISHDKNEQVLDQPKSTPDKGMQQAADLARQLALSEAANDPDSTGPANAPRFGDPNGSAFGNSETGSKDAWIVALLAAMHWATPATLTQEQADKLRCEVRVQIQDHTLTGFTIVQPSGNDIFDQTVTLTLQQAKDKKTQLPDLPAEYKDAAEAGQLPLLFGSRAR